MKIILINNLYKPYAKGGAERVVEITARALRAKGHEVVVITTSPKWKDYEEEIDGIQVFRVYSPNLIFYGLLARLPAVLRIFWHLFDIFNIRAALRVQRIVQQEKPDVVFLHNLKGLSYLTPHFLRAWNTVLVPHDTQLAIPSGVILYGKEHALEHRNLATKLYQVICRILFASVNVVISPSKWLLDFYVNLGFFVKARKLVLHNPALDAEIRHQESGSKNDAKSVLPELVEGHPILSKNLPIRLRSGNKFLLSHSNFLNLLFVGQLEVSKGILFLIQTLQSSSVPFHLTIVGEGSERKSVEKLIRNDARFTYLGKLAHEDLNQEHNCADFTVVPSLVYENCPTVILESFAHGTPVIASRIGGTPELVRNRQNGFLFEPGNSGELLKIFQELPNANLTELQNSAKMTVEGLGIDKYIDQLLVSLRTY